MAIFDRCLIYPKWYDGIKQNKRGLVAMHIVGIDTETIEGKPMTIQIWDEYNHEIVFVNEKNVVEKFIELMKRYSKTDYQTVVFAHNYKDFDLGVLFYPYWKEFSKDEFEIGNDGWILNGRLSGTPEAILRIGKNRVINFIDIYSYFKMSLEKLSTQLGVGEKLPYPKGLGHKRFTEKNKRFISYALNDARLTYHIGKIIFNFMEKYDTRLCLSIAQLSERIFRHHFLNSDWINPNGVVTNWSLRSYHGGKNGFYINPAFVKDVYSYDIVSAYPYAMSKLPDFDEDRFFKTDKLEDKKFFGIYKFDGEIRFCKYPCCFDKHFKPVCGKVKNFYITSPELFEGLRMNEIKIDKIEGVIYAPIKDVVRDTSLKRFVNHFLSLKQETKKDNPFYLFYKTILNSLYGKFIAMHKIPNTGIYLDHEKRYIEEQYKVGNMFHPFIASLITGITRAKIHSLEHKYNAIHTSTDSILTLKEIPQKELSDKLGGLKFEEKGDCLLLRNKVYLMFDEKGNVKKYATHGYRGKAEKLFDMWLKGSYKYEYNHMTKIKESIKQDLIPFKMEKWSAELNLN